MRKLLLALLICVSAHAGGVHTLENGVRILALETSESPLVELRVLMGWGEIDEGSRLPGVSQILSRLMDQNPAWSAFQHAVQIDDDSIMLSLTAPRSETDQALDALIRVVDRFEYPLASIQEEQKIFHERSKQWLENRMGLATWLLQSQIARGTRYAHRNSVGTTGRFEASQLAAFFESTVRRSSLLVGCDQKALDRVVAKFRLLKKRVGPAKMDLRGVASKSRTLPSIGYAKKTGGDQVVLRAGARIPTLNHPDSRAIRIANVILGESALSYYNQRIRDTIGLNYGMQSSLNYARGFAEWTLETSTRIEWVDKVIAIFDEPLPLIDQQRLDWAKSYLDGDQQVQTSSFSERLTRSVYLNYLGESSSKEATLEQVNRAAQMLRPEFWVVVGDVDRMTWEPARKSRLRRLR